MAEGLATGRTLRARIRTGDVVFGVFATMGAPTSSEILARSGFDCVIIDLEHGLGNEATLLDELRAIESAGCSAVVRIEENVPLRASRALDQGAAGIVVPRVGSRAETEAALAYLRYPPDGRRGVALSTRSSGFGTRSHEAMTDSNDRIVCFIQIESEAGIANVAEIASVPGVDVLFVGPSDLSHALGVPGDIGNPVYQRALAQVTAAARHANVACGVMIQDTAELDRHLDLGFTFFLLGADTVFLARSSRETVDAFRARLETRGNEIDRVRPDVMIAGT